MCRVEERVYIGADGNRSKFEDTYHCDKARNGRLCAKVKRRTTEYYPKKGTISRNDTPSPISPPTPVGTGNYLVTQRRPSSSGVRPSTRDGPKAIKPEIIIEFGSKKDKNKVMVSTYKRSSLGTSSDEVAVESPGSDVSRPIHTGFPEAPLPPQATGYAQTDGYGTTPTAHGYHHHPTSSISSFTGSSRTPSLYVTSDDYDYDPPVAPRINTRLPPAIHNPPTNAAPPSPNRPRIHNGASSAPYNTTLVTPDTLFPMDSQDFADRSASSLASSGTSGQSRRSKDHDQPRKKKAEERRREEADRAYAEAIAKEQDKEENVKQVRFIIDRADNRAKQRAETLIAEKEKQRAIDREDARREREEARRRADQERELEAAKERKMEKEREKERERQKEKEREKLKEKEREKQREKEREKERPKIHTSNSSSKRPAHSRRASVTMTAAQLEEQRRLLAADLGHMQGESRAAEAREREESMALLKQQQQDTSYYNPRVGPPPSNAPPLARRDSQSRRNSVSAEPRPTLGRSNSARRTSIVQPNPPSSNGHVPSGYQRPPPSARTHGPPPVSFPPNFNTRPPSTRRPSFSAQENPFAQPPTRGSNSSVENPFAAAPAVQSPPVIHQDPWDARYMRDALPNPQPTSDSRHIKHRHGGDGNHAVGSHSAARDATRAMGRFAGHDIDYVTDSDDEVTHGHGRKRH